MHGPEFIERPRVVERFIPGGLDGWWEQRSPGRATSSERPAEVGAASVETDDRAREAGSRKRPERPFAGPVGPEFGELLKAIIVIVE